MRMRVAVDLKLVPTSKFPDMSLHYPVAMRDIDGRIFFSASDPMRFAGCRHATRFGLLAGWTGACACTGVTCPDIPAPLV